MSEDATGGGLGGVSGGGAAGGASGSGATGGSAAVPGGAGGSTPAGATGGLGGQAGVAPNGGVSLLGRLAAATLPEHPHLSPSTGGVLDYLRTQWGTDHLTAPDPHAQYLTPSEGDALFLTPAEGDARYAPLGGGGGTTDVAITTDASLSSVEAPANTFALATRVSPDANNDLTLHANGLYTPTAASLGYLTQTAADARYPLKTDPDPYTQYLTASRGDALFLTQTEGDARYTQGGLTQAAADARYEPLDSAYTKTEADARYVPLTLPDAKGDLLAASGPDALGRLALGADGQVLTADSAQTLGVKWAAAAGGGSGLPTTGGTMTGTIAAQGGAVDSGGALVVTSPTPAVTDRRVFGPSSPAWTPTTGGAAAEAGIGFQATGGGYLVAARWYRVATGAVAPVALRLWDSTATATPVWSFAGTPPPFSDTAVGWKEYRLPGGTQPALVAGRTYVLAYARGFTSNQTQQTTYTPTPDTGLVFVAHASNATAGVYPPTGGTTAYGIDPAVRSTLAASTPAQSGTVRLPNGLQGAVTWRTGSDGGDLALYPTAADVLTFNGSALLTQTAGDAAYLNVTGDTATGALVLQGASATTNVLQTKLAADTQPRFRADASGLHEWGPGGSTAPDATLQRTGAGALRADTNLGVGVAPAAWRSDLRVVQLGAGSALMDANAAAYLLSNSYYDAAGQKAFVTGAASQLLLGAGTLQVTTAPSVAAGAVQTFTQRLHVSEAGTLTLSPAGGAAAVVAGGGAGSSLTLRKHPSTVNSQIVAEGGTWLEVGGGALVPATDNSLALGVLSNRWTQLSSVSGAINTSLADAKQALTPLDPAAALAAVVATDPVVFDYKPPQRDATYYDLPDDPEPAEALLYQRLTSAPLEAAARHQAGFVLHDATGTYQTDPLFETGSGQSSPQNSVGVLLGAVHELHRRLTALGG